MFDITWVYGLLSTSVEISLTFLTCFFFPFFELLPVVCMFSLSEWCKIVKGGSRMKVLLAWSSWRVCSWSTWEPWTVGLSWASRCVRCRSSPPNTDRCRNHLCWYTEHGGCTGATQLNIHPYLWSRGEGDERCLLMLVRYLIGSFYISRALMYVNAASSPSHSGSAQGEQRVFRSVCFKPAKEIMLQCSLRGWK